jgi:uncharacterized protein
VEPTPAMPGSVSLAAPARKPDWRLVTVFYVVCFAWVSLMALGLHVAGASLSATGAQLTFQFTIAFLYMPAPLVAALIAERVGRRRPLIRTTFDGFGRKLPRLLLAYVGLSTAVYVTFLVLGFVFGRAVHVPGVGVLIASDADLKRNLTAIIAEFVRQQGATPPPDQALSLPPLGALYVFTLLSGLVAGITINGLFAFGEEYGWRGFLMDELRPLGAVRANLLTGVLWGLWHAPIILLGYDYAPHRFLGIPMMVVLCTPLSFLLWRARQFTDSLLEPAMLHGAFNAYGGVFQGRDPLVSLPIGLLGAAGLALVALAFWKWSEGRLAEAPSV